MIIGCDDLTISYHRHPAIHHVSCRFKTGSTTAIIGPNGAGKSTLVNALLGQVKRDSGAVILHGITRKDIAYLPQACNIDDLLPLKVSDVVLFGAWYEMGLFKDIPRSIAQDRLQQCLLQVGLEGFGDRYINELSRGQLQRVLFAKVIMQQAKLIILDEPFNAMDAHTVAKGLELIQSWKAQGITVIAVLHDLNQVANHFDYTLLLARELLSYDKTSAVLSSHILQEAYKNSFAWEYSTCVYNGK